MECSAGSIGFKNTGGSQERLQHHLRIEPDVEDRRNDEKCAELERNCAYDNEAALTDDHSLSAEWARLRTEFRCECMGVEAIIASSAQREAPVLKRRQVHRHSIHVWHSCQCIIAPSSARRGGRKQRNGLNGLLAKEGQEVNGQQAWLQTFSQSQEDQVQPYSLCQGTIADV